MSENYLAQRQEEIDVLQSIFEDLKVESNEQVILTTTPEEPSSSDALTVNLKITYTPCYPDELPDIELEPIEGELSDAEMEAVVGKLKEVGQESLGMAMIYSLSGALQEELGRILAARVAEKKRLENEEVKKSEEREAARSKGTPVTKETFLAWRAKFDEKNRLNKSKEEEDRLKALPPKEREEQKKGLSKMTGKQLFESNRALITSDSSLLDADAEELDLSKFSQNDPPSPDP